MRHGFNKHLEEDVDEVNGDIALRSSTRAINIPIGYTFVNKSSNISRGSHEMVCIGTFGGRWNGRGFLKIKTES